MLAYNACAAAMIGGLPIEKQSFYILGSESATSKSIAIAAP